MGSSPWGPCQLPSLCQPMAPTSSHTKETSSPPSQFCCPFPHVLGLAPLSGHNSPTSWGVPRGQEQLLWQFPCACRNIRHMKENGSSFLVLPSAGMTISNLSPFTTSISSARQAALSHVPGLARGQSCPCRTETPQVPTPVPSSISIPHPHT